MKNVILGLLCTLVLSACNTKPYTPNYDTNVNAKLFKAEEIPTDSAVRFYGISQQTSADRGILNHPQNKKTNGHFLLLNKQGTQNIYVLSYTKWTNSYDLRGVNRYGVILFPNTGMSLSYSNGVSHSDEFSEVEERFLKYVKSHNKQRYNYKLLVNYLAEKEQLVAVNCEDLYLICKRETLYLRGNYGPYYQSTLEALDYSENVKRLKRLIDQREFTQALSIDVPPQFVKPSFFQDALNSAKSNLELAQIEKLMGKHKVGSLAKATQNKRLDLTFNEYYQQSQRGSLTLKKQFVNRYSYLDNDNCYFITASSLNIRRQASGGSRKLGRYLRGDSICAIEHKRGWIKTDKGWISDKFVSKNSNKNYKTKIAQVRQQIDKQDYTNAVAANTSSDYQQYLNEHPRGKFVNSVKEKLISLYVQSHDFDGYIKAYLVKGQRQYLNSAYESLIKQSGKRQVSKKLLDIYIDAAVKSKRDIPRFAQMIAKTQYPISQFNRKLFTLIGFGNGLTTESFFDSPEYIYVLQHLPVQTKFRVAKDKFLIDLDYDEYSKSFEFSGLCEFDREESGVRDIGIIESIFTLGADKAYYYNNIFSCSVRQSDIAKVRTLSRKLGNSSALTDLKGNTNWEYWTESRGTSYEHTRSSSNNRSRQPAKKNLSTYLSRDGVWIKLRCNNGDEYTIRDCENGYFEAGSMGLGACHYNSQLKAAKQVCSSSGGF